MANETQSSIPPEPTDSTQVAERTMSRFLRAGSVEAVYGEPIQRGDVTIIPAAEIVGAMGFGLGSGTGQTGQGNASGAGGGGGIQSRPVATVVITPNGVRVQPIVDMTKLWLAGLTTVGFIVGTISRMNRGRIK